jgi:hypothetical protein
MVAPISSLVPTAVMVTEFATVCVVGDAETLGGVRGTDHTTYMLPEVSDGATEPDGAYAVAEKLYVPAVDVVKDWLHVRVEPDHEQLSLP